MQVDKNIQDLVTPKTLKDFVPLVFAFFGCLVLLSFYQNLRLYFSGVLDAFLNKSLLLSILHHAGFTAVVALFLAFLFNFLEGKKQNIGFRSVRGILWLLLFVESSLIEYYVQNYEIMEPGVFINMHSRMIILEAWPILISATLSIFLFQFLYKWMASFYTVISRMYPFTIILFSLFLATLYSDKKPINENKTQHLISSFSEVLFDFNKYEGKDKFPLLKSYDSKGLLRKYFELREEKPNVVLILLEGMGSDFVGKNAIYQGFTPYLDSLLDESLSWDNFIGNTRESASALPTILGSLPFGQNGFTNLPLSINRNTLYGILKDNGYETSFNYGGNSALNKLDKFLDEERVDHILDKKAFGDGYKLQEKDAAGLSLGYPDGELFKKWNSEHLPSGRPQFDVFLTLSTKNPYLIPRGETYEDKVLKYLAKSKITEKSRKLVKKNVEIFASMVYADESLETFMKEYRKRKAYQNTIFIITASHNLTDLPQTDGPRQYRVPFLIYSPLLKEPKKFHTLTSHADIAPSLMALLDKKYQLKIPSQVAWLGEELSTAKFTDTKKQIPIFRGHGVINDYIFGSYYLSNGNVYKMNEDLSLWEDAEAPFEDIKTNFQSFKSMNKYVTENNSLIPESQALYTEIKSDFSKAEMVWVESVFNGKDFDNAYETARGLAHGEDWERALLLCRYILDKIPRHADTEILMGRIYAWKKDYNKSISVLEACIRKYPKYPDGYAALLDTYFWAKESKKSKNLIKVIEQNNLHDDILNQKLARANKEIVMETKANK